MDDNNLCHSGWNGVSKGKLRGDPVPELMGRQIVEGPALD